MSTEAALDQIWSGEARLLAARRDMREGQKSQLFEQIAQLREQIQGLELQVRAKEKEIALVNIELSSMEGKRRPQATLLRVGLAG